MSLPESVQLNQLTTHWSLLVQAHQGDAAAREAQAELLPRYCAAVYRYLRGVVGDPNTVEELCQEFALRFVRGDFRRADPQRGRFRDYLKVALRHLVIDHQRRLAHQRTRPLDSRELRRTAAPDAGDDDFTDVWRKELLNRTWAELKQFSAAGGRLLYEALRLRADDPGRTSAAIAAELSRRHGRAFTADGARQLVHRARAKFAELLKQEVAASLPSADPDAITAELAELGLLVYCQEGETPSQSDR